MNDWTPEQIGGYELILDQPNDMDRVSYDIVPYLPFDVTSQTIKESFPSIFDWLQLQDQTIYIVMAIMMVIATLNLITCLLILVLERTRMIGLLKALGSPNGTVQRIFLYQGSIISGVGILGGLLLGLLMCWLQYQYGFITLSEDTYYISKAAVYLVWWQVALVVLATFVVCFLILLIPSAIVKTVQPIRAIQFR